jgi:7-carboxy-7-deazaguanine synthase
MLRLLEHYYSVQGEGPRVGVPTQFVRFAGCNLRCPGWPCDTPYAIEPKLFRHEQKMLSSEDLVADIEDMREVTGASNVCLTGGEPMIQDKISMNGLINRLREHGFTIEMFSNGTRPYDYLILSQVSIVMDWKLPRSGEYKGMVGIVGENVKQLRDSLMHSIKFTVKDLEDLETAKLLWSFFHLDDAFCQVFVGPVWGKIEPEEIVNFVRDNKLPWRLNLQTHKYIFDPEARGI